MVSRLPTHIVISDRDVESSERIILVSRIHFFNFLKPSGNPVKFKSNKPTQLSHFLIVKNWIGKKKERVSIVDRLSNGNFTGEITRRESVKTSEQGQRYSGHSVDSVTNSINPPPLKVFT